MNLPPAEHYTDCFYILRTPGGSCVLDYSLEALCKRFKLRKYNLELILESKRRTHNGYSVLRFPIPSDFLQAKAGDSHKMNIQDMQIITTVTPAAAVVKTRTRQRKNVEPVAHNNPGDAP